MFGRKVRVLVCSVHCNFCPFFVGYKMSSNNFKDEITPLLKANNSLNFYQYVKMNHVREEGIPR